MTRNLQGKLAVYRVDRSNGSCVITSPRLGITVEGKTTEAARKKLILAASKLANDADDLANKITEDQLKADA